MPDTAVVGRDEELRSIQAFVADIQAGPIALVYRKLRVRRAELAGWLAANKRDTVHQT